MARTLPDTAQARRFLRALDFQSRENAVHTFQTYPDHDDNPALKRVVHTTSSELGSAFLLLNTNGAGVSVAVNETDGRGRKRANIVQPRAVFCDFDGIEPPSGIGALPHSMVVQSKNGKHLYWLLQPGEDLQTWSQVQTSMAKRYGADAGCSDVPRAMRIPGFFHRKDPDEPFMVQLVSCRPLPRYTLDQIIKAYDLKFEEPRPQREYTPSEDSLADDFNARGTWDFLAHHGWEPIDQDGDEVRWKRPGKRRKGTSATTDHDNHTGIFWVFSSSAPPFDPDRGYTRFQVYSLLEHGGDYAAATKALGAEGFGTDPKTWAAKQRQAREEALWKEREARESAETAPPKPKATGTPAPHEDDGAWAAREAEATAGALQPAEPSEPSEPAEPAPDPLKVEWSDESNTKIYVASLPYVVTDEALRAAFEKFGTIKDATIIKDRTSGRSRGFGFVTYETVAEAKAAVAGMHRVELQGRRLLVKEAEDRRKTDRDVERPKSSDGGGGEKKGNGKGSGGGGGKKGKKLLLDPKKPLETARGLTSKRYWNCTQRTIHHFQGVFHTWGDNRYSDVTPERVRSTVYDFTDNAVKMDEDGNYVDFDPTSRRVSEIVDALKSDVYLDDNLEPPAWIAGVPETIAEQFPNGQDIDAADIAACRNGLLHIPSGKLLEATPAFFSLNSLPFDYEPDAPEPEQWLRFIEALWPEDRESQQLLQRWFGYCLTPDTSQQKALMLIGPKRSGKGTVARTLSALLGGHTNVGSPGLSDLAARFGLWPLIGKTLAIIPDARLTGRTDSAPIIERILAITGEDSIQIDRKGIAPVEKRLKTRMVLLTNELPRVQDPSGAFVSRFLVLTLQESFFGREDRALQDKILAELPGILNWAVQGWRDLREAGAFDQPKTSQMVLEEFDRLTSPIHAFLQDVCRVGDEQEIAFSALWELWKTWCENNGRNTGASNSFARDLRAALPTLSTRRGSRSDGKRLQTYIGLGAANDS